MWNQLRFCSVCSVAHHARSTSSKRSYDQYLKSRHKQQNVCGAKLLVFCFVLNLWLIFLYALVIKLRDQVHVHVLAQMLAREEEMRLSEEIQQQYAAAEDVDAQTGLHRDLHSRMFVLALIDFMLAQRINKAPLKRDKLSLSLSHERETNKNSLVTHMHALYILTEHPY